MKMGRNLVVSLGALGALVAPAFMFGACSSSSSGGVTPATDSGGGGGGDSMGGGMAPMCSAAPGAFPAPNCDNSAQICPAMGLCPTVSCSESTAPGNCQPLANNTGKTTLDFRISALTIAAPMALASTTVQGGVVTPAISLSKTQAPNCGESGTGTFNWLISVDKTNKTLTTGGGPASTDPFTTGYCFVNSTFGGIKVSPVTGPITFTGSAFSSTPLTSTLNIPIFYDTLADPIILPIRGGALNNVTISSDDDCIGSFNPTALDGKCADDSTMCSKWHTGGALGGYITLQDADNVNISLLGESLCVLLTGTGATKTAAGKCPANAFTMGDYCSTTSAPGGCNDSEWLASTFSASAVTINSGAGVSVCTGGSGPTDAGGGGG